MAARDHMTVPVTRPPKFVSLMARDCVRAGGNLGDVVSQSGTVSVPMNDSRRERWPLLCGRRGGLYVFQKRIGRAREAVWPWILVAAALLAGLEVMAP